LNIQNTSFAATLDSVSWKDDEDFNATTKQLSLISDTTEGAGVVTATYYLVDPQNTETEITVNGQSTVQGTWTAVVRYPNLTYKLSDETYGGSWQWKMGAANIITDDRYGIDAYSDLPESFTSDFYHYLDNTTYNLFDAYKTVTGRDYAEFNAVDNKLLTGYPGAAVGYRGLLHVDINEAEGSTFCRRDDNGAVATWTLGGETWYSQWAAATDWTLDTGTTDGYANFLFQNITFTDSSWPSYSYTISGGFLGTEPYKSKYKGLTDLIMAIYVAQYYDSSLYGLAEWTSAINAATDPTKNKVIKKIFGFALEGYFFGSPQSLNLQANTSTNSYHRQLLLRDARRLIANTNIEYNVTYNSSTGYSITPVFSSTYPSGDYIQRGGPGVVTLGYNTQSEAFLAQQITGLSGTVNNSTPINPGDGLKKMYAFVGWSTVNPADANQDTYPSMSTTAYSYYTCPTYDGYTFGQGKCPVYEAIVMGNKPATITSDTSVYPVYKVASRVGIKIWNR